MVQHYTSFIYTWQSDILLSQHFFKFVGEKFQRGKISSITKDFVNFPRRKISNFRHFPRRKNSKFPHFPFKYLPLMSVKTNKQTAGCKSHSYRFIKD